MKLQSEGAKRDELHAGEMFEERVRRSRCDHLISGITQQLEKERVRFAGRRREDEIVGFALKLGRQGLACRPKSERMGIVASTGSACHRRRQLVERIVNAGLRRIRLRQIEDFAAPLLARGSETVGCRVPVGAFRKTHEQVRRAAASPLSMSARASAREDGTASIACRKVRIASSHAPFATSTRASVSRIR